MLKTLMVIDDFLPDPMVLRQQLQTIDFEVNDTQKYYPGRNATTSVIINGLDDMISKLVGEPLQPAPHSSHGRLRLALGDEVGRGGVHVDECHWSGILYLTPDEYCQGGTDFFRHKATNSDRAPLTRQDLANIGFSDFQTFWTELLLPESRDFDKWELTTHVPMKFNRLILFRPWLYHNAGPSFGDSIENGRLIYPLFFNPKAQ